MTRVIWGGLLTFERSYELIGVVCFLDFARLSELEIDAELLIPLALVTLLL